MYYNILDRIKNHPVAIFVITLVLIFIFNQLLATDMTLGIVYMTIFIVFLVLIIIYNRPLYAVIFNLISSFLLFYFVYRVMGIRSIPLGFILDGSSIVALVVLISKNQLSGFRTHIGILISIWFMICFMEVVNPMAASRVAWIHAIRAVFTGVAPYFILYSLFKSQKNILKPLLIIWISLCTLTALYTLYQEFVGLPPWDHRFVYSDPKRAKLFVTFGRLRKFAFLGNPTENGLLLFINALLCFGLSFTENIRRRNRIIFLLCTLLSSWAMIYTGTRTATILFVFGFALYVVFRRKKELWIAVACITVLLTGYIVKTGGGGAMSVMTTAFNDDDPSLQARLKNQRTIRNFLYKSPIGYGMGSNGFLGRKYSPHTLLGSIPPDSELVRLMIEVGFLGAAFYLYMFYRYISTSAQLMLLKSDDFSNNFRIIITVLLLVILLGHYPQQIMIINSLKIFVSTLLAYITLKPEEAEEHKWDLSKTQ